MIKVGVFDSGIGGLSVAKAIEKAMPDVIVQFVNDHEHVPYGNKTNQQLLEFSLPILKTMEQNGCDLIVIACNTLTTTIISQLRAALKVPLVAVEPMVKPAATMTKTGVIAVCATPATLASSRYAYLKQTFAPAATIVEPDCSNWAELIENNKLDRQQLAETINQVLIQGADVIVLGCTHYHWIEEDIRKIVDGQAQVIQPEQAIIKRLRQEIKQLV